MAPLPPDLRKALDKSVVDARDKAEEACRAALNALGVDAREAPAALSDEDRQLRNALRAKQRQLGGAFEQLVAECAYEQWHLMLFARFLAENELLIHPEHGTAVPLREVAELARDEGEGDPWLLAARYAAAMLPGIFKTSDPCVRLPLAPEGRKALEEILTELSAEVFTADDALGWVYQFWQTKKKKEVNASERKIGGADLAPVTQLFTEHYMVRFLLENSLGAWWAARHPESPLLAEWDYLRFTDDGQPAAGRFEGWPDSVAEVTVMDPCCGSGHFQVAAFDMLRKMREEEEGLSTRDAVDAVLRDNLYGLELDARCVQLAAFALALAAWKAAGYHKLPALNLACSGIPTRGSLDEWTKLAKGDERLERALTRLHEVFREADTLGSLIDPRRAVEDGSLMSVPFDQVAPLLERALSCDPNPVAAVFSEGAREVAKAAALLSCSYTLVATNPPYLVRSKQNEYLRGWLEMAYPHAVPDIATAFLERCGEFTGVGGASATVTPQNWLALASYRGLRQKLLLGQGLRCLARVGSGATATASWDVLRALAIVVNCEPNPESVVVGFETVASSDSARSADLARVPPMVSLQSSQLRNASARIAFSVSSGGPLLKHFASSLQGLKSGDDPRLVREHWEVVGLSERWRKLQSTVTGTEAYAGMSRVVDWVLDGARLARRQGLAAWGHSGVAVSQMRSLPASLYIGEAFDSNVSAIVPEDPEVAPAIWAYCSSDTYYSAVRRLDQSLSVTNAVMIEVPFDLEHWAKVAAEQYPNGLPEPHSNDPTQWLFKGNVVGSEQPLHIALARLLGYRWPDQKPDQLDGFADEDGIVCLPPVAGERPAHERLRELLAAAYAPGSPPDGLLASEGCRNLDDWLRDKAFASHAKLFHNRPFIWHVWDERKDGFAALVNYHKLDEQTLQKLTYTYLGWWIDRQKADATAEVAGAETRLAAATELQNRLKLILEGEAPNDIYVRWKPLAEQPLGWQPDLNDGVRLNIRPLVTAGVLRAKLPSIHWNKDRGKNPDGSERLNDLHTTLAEKRAAREERRTGE